MNLAEQGDEVAIHYIGTLDNGRIFDSRDDDNPLICTLGRNEIFPTLENEIIGMRVGQVKNILVQAEDAFGLRKDENIIRLERTAFPSEKEIKLGQKISIDFKDGSSRVVRIVQIDDSHVTVDGNHALAGHDLTFALKLDKIISKS